MMTFFESVRVKKETLENLKSDEYYNKRLFLKKVSNLFFIKKSFSQLNGK